MQVVSPEGLDKVDEIRASYNELQYESWSHPLINPARLGGIGRLLGMATVPADCARILELGCATGGNCIPHALAYPKATIVGLDLSEAQVAQGQADIQALGLSNIVLRQCDLGAGPFDLGKFDYIICHGVFSWVPPHVQEGIFKLIESHLAPEGLAMVSCNTYPGWHLWDALRHALLDWCSKFEGATAKVAAAKDFYRLMAKTAGTSSSYGKFLDAEKERFLAADESYVFHEFLEGCNSPEYFSDWVARARSHALSYVADAEFSSHFATGLEPEALSHLDAIVDPIRREQFLDYFVSRTFRHNILALEGARPVTELDAEALKYLWLAGSFKCESEPGLLSVRPTQFETPSGVTISAIFPIAKAACLTLESVWPRPICFSELLLSAQTRLSETGTPAGERDQDLLVAFLKGLCRAGAIELFNAPRSMAAAVSERPLASAWSRHEVKRGRSRIGSLLHESVQLSPPGRYVLSLCDGTRTVEQIGDSLAEALALGTIDDFDSSGNKVALDPNDVSGLAERILLALSGAGMLLE